MNQEFSVSNTTTDITHVGPLSQQISLDKNASITLDQTITTLTGNVPLTMAAIKQAALGSSITIRPDPAGGNIQNLTLNKAVGAANGSVSSALASQLGLTRANDGVTINFAVFAQPPWAAIGVSSDDTFITTGPVALFPANTPGIGYLAIELSTVGTTTTPPSIVLTAANTACA